MIALDMAAVLAVFVGIGLVLAGLAIGWDNLTYWAANRAERRDALARARRHHPATRERVR